MNSIFITEFKEDIKYLKKKLLTEKKIIVISVNSNISSYLKKNKISFIELNDFWDEKFNYETHLKKTLNITKVIKPDFLSSYSNFLKYDWNIIDDFIYPIKINYDQLFYYTFCLNKILLKYKISKVYIAYNEKIIFSKGYQFPQNQSVLYHLLKLKKKIKIFPFRKISKDYTKQINKFSFAQIKSKIKIFISNNLLFKSRLYFKNQNIISLSSHEIESLFIQQPDYKKDIINLPPNYYLTSENTDKKSNDLISKLRKNDKLSKLLLMNNFDVSKLFLSQISNISLFFDVIFKRFLFYFNIITKINTKLIIFNTITPFNHQNIIFNKISNLKKIPKVIWCHGGYCDLNLSGFDVTDFKESKNHFSYGKYLQQIIDEKIFLPKKIFKIKYKTFDIGSPHINLNFKPQLQKKNTLKKIIFIRGAMYQHNQTYFPDNGSGIYDDNILTEEVLNILKEFQNSYDIVFKDYPYPTDMGFWKEYLYDNGFNKVRYVSNELPLNKILENNQLVILPWMSTTFFQSLPYKNKIFIYDEKLYLKAFKNCNDEINCFTNKEIFLKSLKLFLKKMNQINFKSNKNTIKHFLNGNDPNNIKRNFDSAVNTIVKSDFKF